MNVDSILISDYADVIDGKLTVVGVFNLIYAESFPFRHAALALSLVIHGHRDERDREFQLEIRVVDEQRREIAKIGGVLRFPPEKIPIAALPLRAVVAPKIYGAVFPHPGAYAFEVYIDGTYHAAAVLAVVPAQGQADAAPPHT